MSYKLHEIDVGILLIQDYVKDFPRADPRSFVDLLIDQFETKFLKSFTVLEAKDIASRALSHLTLVQLRRLYGTRFGKVCPVFFSKTEVLKELRA